MYLVLYNFINNPVPFSASNIYCPLSVLEAELYTEWIPISIDYQLSPFPPWRHCKPSRSCTVSCGGKQSRSLFRIRELLLVSLPRTCLYFLSESLQICTIYLASGNQWRIKKREGGRKGAMIYQHWCCYLLHPSLFCLLPNPSMVRNSPIPSPSCLIRHNSCHQLLPLVVTFLHCQR